MNKNKTWNENKKGGTIEKEKQEGKKRERGEIEGKDKLPSTYLATSNSN
jgi:hypothetical protein